VRAGRANGVTITIDARAVVAKDAELGPGVHVGPFCVVGSGVTIGPRTWLESHVVIDGPTTIGADNVIAATAALGGAPQDVKYRGAPTRLEIGDRNQIREGVTLHRGTEHGGGVTRIGDDNFFMVHSHVGHDCQVGSRTTFVNGATLGGHVEVGDGATVGAFSAVHQFCRVARFAFLGGGTMLTQDALPWVLTVGNRARACGLNVVGLKRSGYPQATVDAIRRCYRLVFQSKVTLADGLSRAEAELGHVAEVRYFVDFVRSSRRGVCR
jgi:UDP-N-acetylglucosamine acyltransferase